MSQLPLWGEKPSHQGPAVVAFWWGRLGEGGRDPRGLGASEPLKLLRLFWKQNPDDCFAAERDKWQLTLAKWELTREKGERTKALCFLNFCNSARRKCRSAPKE